jgi:hypothetical protein
MPSLVSLLAEFGLVSVQHSSGGGRLVAVSVPAGRYGPLVDGESAPKWLSEFLPEAFNWAEERECRGC